MRPSSTLFAIIITSGLMFGCSPAKSPEPPLSDSELNTLTLLQTKYAQTKQKLDAYKEEVERIKHVSPTYLSEHVSLLDFSFYKSNNFDDRRGRLCFRGQITNGGNEIIEQLDIRVALNDTNGNTITEWETALVSANEHVIDKDPNNPAIQMSVAILGKQLPLDPNETKDLSKAGRCMKEVYLNWEEEDVDFELTNLRLRTKLSEVDSLSLIRINAELSPLKSRARANQQLP